MTDEKLAQQLKLQALRVKYETEKHKAPIHRTITENYWIGLKYAQSFGFFVENPAPHEIDLKGDEYSVLDYETVNMLGFDEENVLKNQRFPEQFAAADHPQVDYICAQNDIELLKWIGANSDEHLKDPRHRLALAAARAVVRTENSHRDAGTHNPGASEGRTPAASVAAMKAQLTKDAPALSDTYS